MIDTLRRIKWKNITGLIILMVIVFTIVFIINILNGFIYGDCVEKDGTKVCFSVDKTTLNRFETSVISIDVSNTGKALSDATIISRMSPNLENKTAMTEVIKQMAPGDTIQREFRIAAKDEKGRFKVEFDINGDGVADKELFLSVK